MLEKRKRAYLLATLDKTLAGDVCKLFAGADRVGRVSADERERRLPGAAAAAGKFSAKIRSFSAVSAPISARKYASCSIFQNLPDYLAAAEIFEIWQI